MLHAEDATDEDGTDTKPSRNKKTSARAAARGKEKLMSAQEKSSKKRTGTGLARLQKAAYKFLFGWLDPKLKRNGKKIIADHQVLVKFMVSVAESEDCVQIHKLCQSIVLDLWHLHIMQAGLDIAGYTRWLIHGKDTLFVYAGAAVVVGCCCGDHLWGVLQRPARAAGPFGFTGHRGSW